MHYNYRYHTPDPYCYPNSDVLVNKLGIEDFDEFEKAESCIAGHKLCAMRDKPVMGKFGFAHLKSIHRAIFSDVYDWAGEIRKGEFLLKGDSLFVLGRNIDVYAKDVFAKLSKENKLRGLPKTQFAERLAYFMGEINVLHPFREGNGRTAREFFRLLSKSAGYTLDWKAVDKNALLNADISAFNKDYDPLVKIIKEIVIRR